MEPPPAAPREQPPKDGIGPRGLPETYHTARVLDSTARYEKFVRKLRNLEEEQRRGAINTLKDLKDTQYNDFFIRCDRRSLINNVARRVDLCMASYQEDLKAKRQRLTALLTAEEEKNIRLFVEQAQAGAEAVWQEKKDRLAYLLAKRKKEHEDKYRDVPISKCVHVQPCLVKMRSKESQEGQLYQMKENLAKKMSEIEIEKMWHAVALKEADALAARMEVDAMERLRREQECAKYSKDLIARRKEQKRKEQELLKEESKKFKELFEEYKRKEEAERKAAIRERQETLEKQQAEAKLINDTWDSLSSMGIMDEKNKEDLRKKKARELNVCNKHIVQLKEEKARNMEADDPLFEAEARKIQDAMDQKRCQEMMRAKKINDEARAGVKEQIKENAATRANEAAAHREVVQYQRQLGAQLDQLERQKQEDLDQRKKCMMAADDYQNEITKIMCRKMYSGLKMQEKCPCSKPDYCAVPVRGPKLGDMPKTSQQPNPTENRSEDAGNKVVNPAKGSPNP
ncbi:hypothetical protein HF086_005282 [Spodoptera exigua]|uniref:Uncharacterized protein n=1 Tax=Spodoptera exigua TaxID=7107 RepID=A0A922SSI9_SPOEX|nr:hypothetical protein HF086_005282 [Spodoptera exigua]